MSITCLADTAGIIASGFLIGQHISIVELIDLAYQRIQIPDRPSICKCSRLYQRQNLQELVSHGRTYILEDSELRPILLQNEMGSISFSL